MVAGYSTEYTQNMEDRAVWRQLAWWFGGIVVGFKTWTVLLIFVFSVDWSTAWYLILNHVAWLIGIILMVWGPLLFWYRLVRVRLRRERLVRSEWGISETIRRRR